MNRNPVKALHNPLTSYLVVARKYQIKHISFVVLSSAPKSAKISN